MYFCAVLEGSGSDTHCLRSRKAGEYLDICFGSPRPAEGAAVPRGLIFYPRPENFPLLTSSSPLRPSEIGKDTREVRLGAGPPGFAGVSYLLQIPPASRVHRSRERAGLAACVSAGAERRRCCSRAGGKAVSGARGESRAVWRLKGRLCAWFLFGRNEGGFFFSPPI